jgi:hypothetical protein
VTNGQQSLQIEGLRSNNLTLEENVLALRQQTEETAKTANETRDFVSESNTMTRLNEAKNVVATAQSILGNSNLGALKNVTPDRTITEEDRAKFISLIKGVPSGNVEVWVNGSAGAETIDYAEEIRQMVGACGYNVGRQCAMGFGTGIIPKGVYVGIKTITNQPPFAGAIQRALIAIGINAKGYEKSDIKDNQTMEIYVGQKP